MVHAQDVLSVSDDLTVSPDRAARQGLIAGMRGTFDPEATQESNDVFGRHGWH
jgi:hypothetical protein